MATLLLSETFPRVFVWRRAKNCFHWKLSSVCSRWFEVPLLPSITSNRRYLSSPDFLELGYPRRQRSRAKFVVTFQDIEAARERIADAVYYSPCRPSIPLSEITGMEIFCKFDNLQQTGSFKERGARNSLAQLSADQQKRGVIAASAGNHAQALAYQGKLLGIPATVVMPQYAALIKVSNCQMLGANVILHGKDFAEAKAHADKIATEKGLAYIDGYDDPAIIAGQGTMGIEIIDQVKDVDAVIVPLGGAGLLAGVSLAVKTLRPDTKIIAV